MVIGLHQQDFAFNFFCGFITHIENEQKKWEKFTKCNFFKQLKIFITASCSNGNIWHKLSAIWTDIIVFYLIFISPKSIYFSHFNRRCDLFFIHLIVARNKFFTWNKSMLCNENENIQELFVTKQCFSVSLKTLKRCKNSWIYWALSCIVCVRLKQN